MVQDGVIADITETRNFPRNIPVEDFGNSVVMAGLVDTHVHINEPGRTDWEGFGSATKAAAAGGVTMLVDMPLNSSPVTTTVMALEEKIAASRGKLFVDCGFYGGVVPGNTDQLKLLIDAGVLGIKAFLIDSGIDDFPNVNENDLRAAMRVIAESDVPLLVHAELEREGLENGTRFFESKSYNEYLSSRPRSLEKNSIDLLIRLCREYNCRTHIVHLSSADEIPALVSARRSGVPLSVETCPHYLYFFSEEIPDGDTRFKCAPPIRERDNRERLWDALRAGVVDCIVSDHSPCPPEMKMLREGNFQKAWGGIASLQFGLSIIWTEASKRGFSVTDIAEWMIRYPAELVGISGTKGTLSSGCDADIVVWNPEASFVIEPFMIEHRHKLTPYEGRTLLGKVEKTFLRGKKIFDNGRFLGETCGKVMLRTERHASDSIRK